VSLSLTSIGAIFLGIYGDFINVYILSFPFWNTGLVILAVVFIAYWTTFGFNIALFECVNDPRRWFCLGSLL